MNKPFISSRDILRQVIRDLFSRVTVSIWIVTMIGCVFSGPFGTYETLSLGKRALFWPVLLSVAILTGYSARLVAMLVIGPGHLRLFHVLHAIFSALCVSGALKLVMVLFYAADPSRVPPWFGLFLTALGVTIAVTLFRVLVPGLRDPFSALLEKEDAPRPRLADRLEDPEAKIIRLTVEDHFVDVISDRGRERLRMRFSDAVNEMEPVEGFWTHRSHWVVSDAATHLERMEGRLYLRLDNGEKVPVSRKYREDLEQAGLPETESANRSEPPEQKRRELA